MRKTLFWGLKKSIEMIALSKRNEFLSTLNDPMSAQKRLSKLFRLDQNPRYFSEPLSDPRQFSEEKVLFWECTSGSTGTKKFIPYTSSLRSAFSEMALLWIHDVLTRSGIPFKTGVFYMSISPIIGNQSGKRIDSEYLAPGLRQISDLFLAAPASLRFAESEHQFYRNLAQALLRRRMDLEAISIWSPTFFLRLLDWISKNHKEYTDEQSLKLIWPNLKLISCWSSASSNLPAKSLHNLFPQAHLQPKGLLATEGPMTIPWSDLQVAGGLPLPHLIYYEFIDSRGSLKSLNELNLGESYEIVPSFPNGLYRYRIGDFVKVTGSYKSTPVLDFIGRGSETSDLVGEKLTGPLLRKVFQDLGLRNFVVLPSSEANRYELFYDAEREFLESEFEARLNEIHHYALARALGQLQPVKSRHIPDLGQVLLEIKARTAEILGDVKEENLISQSSPIYQDCCRTLQGSR